MQLNRRSFLAAASAALAALKLNPSKLLAKAEVPPVSTDWSTATQTPLENFREVQALAEKYDATMTFVRDANSPNGYRVLTPPAQ